MRDIQKQAAQGNAIIRRHPLYDMSVLELLELIDIYEREKDKDALRRALVASFYMGIATGDRIRRNDEKKHACHRPKSQARHKQ